MLSSFTLTGTLPTAWAASVWNSTPRSRGRCAPISRTGCNTPISLLAYMTLTRMVLSVMAARSASRSSRPSRCTGRKVTLEAVLSRRLQVSSTALCSVAAVMMWLPLLGVHLGHALDGQVVGLRGAAGEDDFLGGRADQLGDLLAAPSPPPAPRPSRRRGCGWRRCRTSPEIGQHGVEHARVDAAWSRGSPGKSASSYLLQDGQCEGLGGLLAHG